MTAPSLFDVAAEQEAIATGKPVSQTRLEIEHPAPRAFADDSLFAPRPIQTCERCGAAFKARPRVPTICNLCRR